MKAIGTRALCGFASASLLALGQAWATTAPISIAALAPWFVALGRSRPAEALVAGVFVGTMYGCLVALWIPEALLALGSSSLTAASGLVLTAAWAKAPVFGALAVSVTATKGRPLWARAIVVGAAVALLEWIVSTSRWGVPWALVGHSQLPLLGVSQLAVVGGVPAISALLVAVNLAWAGFWQGPSREGLRTALALTAGWASLALWGLSAAEFARPEPTRERQVKLLVVQPDIPRGERWGPELQALNLQRVAAFVDRSTRSELETASALVLPENLLTDPVDAREELQASLKQWVDRLGIPVIAGLALAADGSGPGAYRSSVVWIEPGKGTTARIDKVRAVPVVESGRPVPGESLLGPLFGAAADWKKVEEAADAGPLVGSFTVTPVLCYEALFPGLVADRRTPDSVAILNLADDGWVQGDAATRQLTHFATFRAIEQRLTLIRVAHGGLSVVVDPFGRRVEALPLDEYAFTSVAVSPIALPTLGEKITILALPVSAGLVVWWSLSLLPRRKDAP